MANMAWMMSTVPLECQTGVLVPLFKKEHQRVCSNCRGITLLSIPRKVYTRVLERRVWRFVEPQVHEEQFVIHPGLFLLKGAGGSPTSPQCFENLE